jgi:hypothetical protein
MPKIQLSSGFSLIPIGTYIFQITKQVYKEDYGKLELTLTMSDGTEHIEKYSLIAKDGSPNNGAINAFSYLAKTALDDFDRTEIEPEELIGCYIECDVDHDVQPSTKDPSKTFTYVRLADKRPAIGFMGGKATPVKTAAAKPIEKPAVSGQVSIDDLDDLLG